LVLSAVLTTVDGSHHESLGVKVPAVDLARVSQLEKTLTDLWRSAVNFVEEEHYRLLTSGHKPVRSVPSGSLATVDSGVGGVGQTKEITLSHLACAALDHRQVAVSSNLIDHFGLADAVTTADQHGQLGVEDEGSGLKECESVCSLPYSINIAS
jgi:hypothetical protein